MCSQDRQGRYNFPWRKVSLGGVPPLTDCWALGRGDPWAAGGGLQACPAPWSTHYSVWWRCAPDEAFDLAFLTVEGVLGLGAGDDGGSC